MQVKLTVASENKIYQVTLQKERDGIKRISPSFSEFLIELNSSEISYFSDAIGRIRVLSVKTALSTLCAGRLVDKLRCKYVYNFANMCTVI